MNYKQESERYMALGVSAAKDDVRKAISGVPKGILKSGFCNVVEDIFENDPLHCVVSHADGAGSKSILAYIYYVTYGNAEVFKGIAQDAIVMNLDDLLCVGATQGFAVTSIINRNAKRIDASIVKAVIEGSAEFIEKMNAWGIPMTFCGGETADMGDTVRTIIVDAVLTVRMLKASLVANKIRPDQTIIALASGGSPATYETSWNSGIGSNGLTAARHELLQKSIAEKHPEVFDKNTSNDLIFKGPFGLHDSLPGSPTTALEALLSPTRTYAPVIASLLKNYSQHISGLVHCSGGGQLKCLRFGKAIVYHKTLPSEPPPIFTAIRAASGMSWGEMAKIFNLGYRFEIYCDPVISKDVIEIASRFNIAATEIGYTRKSADINNHLILTCESEEFRYSGKPWED